MSTCKTCGSEGVTVGRVGGYALFFYYRVRPDQCDPNLSEHRTAVQWCPNCRTLAPAHEFTEAQLEPLYADYHKESYMRERLFLEPWYAQFSNVTTSRAFREARTEPTDAFLKRNECHLDLGRVLDFGGDVGYYTPPYLLDNALGVELFDPSAQPARDSRIRVIDSIAGKYNLVLCQHVLEHVGNPRELVKYLLTLGEVLFVEVPLEGYAHHQLPEAFAIHEHLNHFSPESFHGLAKSLGLTMLDAEISWLESGPHSMLIGRYLLA